MRNKVFINPFNKGRNLVEEYGDEALSNTPVDNRYVLELLKSLGIEDIHDFLDSEKAGMFIRSF